MMIISVILIGSFLILVDLVPLYKRQEWKTFFVYSFILAVILALAVVSDYNIEIPNPTKLTEKIASFIFGIKSN